MSTTTTRHLSIAIDKPFAEVVAFVADPANMPQWASGLGDDFHRDGDAWVAKGGLGTVRVRFAPKNDLGVVDHDVTLPDGTTVHNPLRVLKNGTRSEVVFTLFRLPGVDDAAFAKDAAHIEKDLATLKQLLERQAS